jgi:starch synthase (maltosyl-transferring)
MNIPQKMMIYNLFPLLAGPFTGWGNHFPRVQEMGFNWIFVNPVQRPGESGSLYAIRDYFSLNPRLVDDSDQRPAEDQLREAIREAGRHDLQVMVDLVINHCAADSKLIEEHPEWFVWESENEVAHPFAKENGKKVVWRDLARFDHQGTEDGEGLLAFFADVAEYLIDLGFRAFRCDAAYQVPARVWDRLIKEVKGRHPQVLFLAETLGCTIEQTRQTAKAGFDFIFNSAKWWDFESPWLIEQYQLTRDTVPSIGFPESHDTPRLCEQLQGDVNGLKQRYLFTALFSAGVMMPMGFEFGFRKKTHVVESRPEDWEETEIDISPFIAAVNEIKGRYEIFQEESPLHVFMDKEAEVMILWKGSAGGREEALLILNKDIRTPQRFSTKDLCQWVQADTPLQDLSPEDRCARIPRKFSCELRPGQGVVLWSERKEEA